MLQQVIAYNVIEGTDHTMITKGVNTAIKGGWVPSGPLVMQGEHLLQAVVRFGAANS